MFNHKEHKEPIEGTRGSPDGQERRTCVADLLPGTRFNPLRFILPLIANVDDGTLIHAHLR